MTATGDGQADTQSVDVMSSSPQISRKLGEKETLGPSSYPARSRRKTVSFAPGDSENPYNWSAPKKTFIVITVINTVFNSTLNSGATAGNIKEISAYFDVSNAEEWVLPVSMYLLGYVFGPLVFGPASEQYGRKLLTVSTYFVFLCFTLACPLAPNWPAFLIFRFLQGTGASAPISMVGGIYADIFNDPITRGRAVACFVAATCFGPVFGPVVSGFLSPVGWKWSFWVTLIYAGISYVPVLLLPETYAPVLLRRRAQKLRKETGDENIVAPAELEEKGLRHVMTIVLTRPIRMFLFEPIVTFSCLYSSFTFGVFYLFFDAYPIIFQGIYGLSNGGAGCAFIPIAIGGVIACCIFLWWDSILQRAKKAGKPWAQSEEYRRLPLACLAGPLWVISLFWLAWTANAKIHWIVPMLAGIPCGTGYLMIFMALLNYTTDAYEIYSASALAANATTRSIFGVALPFAAKSMYGTLGVHWATSLLGFLSLAMTAIPFVFIKFGPQIRAKSKFCQALKKAKEEAAARQEDPDEDESFPSSSDIVEEKV